MKENQHIEYKSSFNDSVIETLVAFANSKGGKVLVGVNDDGRPNTNFKYGKETFQKWINEIKVKTQPAIAYFMYLGMIIFTVIASPAFSRDVAISHDWEISRHC